MTTDLISKLFLLHSVIRKEVNAAFKQGEYPWRFEHYVFLSAIPPGKGIPLKYISTAVFGRDQSSLRRALDSLEKAKLIRLKRETTDRRHLRVHITSEGTDVLAALHRLATDSLDQALACAEPDILAGLASLLNRLQVDADLENSEVA